MPVTQKLIKNTDKLIWPIRKLQIKSIITLTHGNCRTLTETGVLDRVSVVVVDLVAALALVPDDALRGAVTPASLVSFS